MPPSSFNSIVERKKHWVTICAWHLVETIQQKNTPRPFVLNESNLLLAKAKCSLSFCQKWLVYHLRLLSSHTIMETLWDMLKKTQHYKQDTLQCSKTIGKSMFFFVTLLSTIEAHWQSRGSAFLNCHFNLVHFFPRADILLPLIPPSSPCH